MSELARRVTRTSQGRRCMPPSPSPRPPRGRTAHRSTRLGNHRFSIGGGTKATVRRRLHEALRARSGPPISRAGLGREATDEEIAREDQHGNDAVILPPETWNADRDQVAELLTQPRSTAQQARCAGSTAAGSDGFAHGCSGGAKPAAGDAGRVQRLRIAALRRVSLGLVPGRASGRRVLQTMPAKALRTDRPDGGVAPRYVTGGRRAVPGAPEPEH